MSRKSNTEQRRAEIAQAMLSVMAEQGYEKSTIQAIAQRAGLTPGLIHYHFQTKEAILLMLVDSIAALVRARYLHFAQTATTAREKLQAYIDARLAKGPGALPEAVTAWVVIGTEAARQPEVRDAYQKAIAKELALVQELIQTSLGEAGKRKQNAPRLAAALVAFMEGTFQLASAAADVMPQGYAASTATLLADSFIAAEPARKSTARAKRS